MKRKINQNPILVTGSHRSGATFVGKMLALSPRIGYIDEPFHRVSGIEGINRWFLYIREFFDQKDLMHDHLDEILKDCKLENLSIAEEGALLWKCIYKVLFCYLRRNSKENINRWKNLLSTNEAETIYKITADLAKQYYTDNEW